MTSVKRKSFIIVFFSRTKKNKVVGTKFFLFHLKSLFLNATWKSLVSCNTEWSQSTGLLLIKERERLSSEDLNQQTPIFNKPVVFIFLSLSLVFIPSLAAGAKLATTNIALPLLYFKPFRYPYHHFPASGHTGSSTLKFGMIKKHNEGCTNIWTTNF